ncbi:DNA repair protein RecO [Flavobacterium salilacus subsp. salilacus]|uniref:DNA repair protein RecO n=1 Tax=Flavobacterium TaxID=237 RepID=UPI00107586B4|nr:DNA repair protein RecO [Flavobacterium salilacus]KAF2518241.1 DNA repair protein RecO [Flavobacterium salilacus subsp. salilacus]MBE1615349.1 DNA repair protein RecO [Flavobacterium sp. SaA2.13]
MLVKTNAIVISSLRYQEKSLIVKCFTASDGLKSYYVRDAFSSRKSSQKTVYFRPLNILEIEASHKNNGRLEYFKEVRLAHPYHSINTDIVKTSIAIFISEILHHCIKEEEQNQNLYNYLETALLWLDTHDEVANFHLILLLEITKFLGFYPESPANSNPYFEMSDGVFIPFETISCLSEKETVLLRKLMLLKPDNAAKVFHVSERQALLKILMDYYSLHMDGFVRPKSIEVLKEVFS